MASTDNYTQLSSLPEDIRQKVLDFIASLMKGRQDSEPQGKRRTPVPGLAKGMVTIPEDFDAPLDDFKDYMR